MELPNRKHIRLPDYDYTQNGAYFVTICTQNRAPILGLVGWDLSVPPLAHQLVERWLNELPKKFPACRIDQFVVMPNHIHFLLRINRPATAGHTDPALPHLMQWFKAMTTNDYIRGVRDGVFPPFAKRLWQTGYYEEVIRNEEHYLNVWQYIETNPARWAEDEYFEE